LIERITMKYTYRAIYEGVYKLHAKYGKVPPQDMNDDFWDNLTAEASAYYNAHDDTFARALLQAAVAEIERVYEAAQECGQSGGKQR
jgi:hypothetical protein